MMNNIKIVARRKMEETGRIAKNDPDVDKFILMYSGECLDNLSFMKGNTYVEWLFIVHCNLEHIHALEGNAALLYINIEECGLRDIHALNGMMQLTELTLSSNQISDVSPLQGLIKLKRLDLSDNPIRSIEPLRGLTSLRELNLSGISMRSADPLRELVSLRILDLSNTSIAIDAIDAIGVFDILVDIGYHLVELNIRRCGISSNVAATVLKGCPNIEILDIGDNPLDDIEFIHNLPRLKTLICVDCSITDIGALAYNETVTTIDMDENPITSVECIGSNKTLTHISLKHCNITDISALCRMPNLATLDVCSNPNITDIECIYSSHTITSFFTNHGPCDYKRLRKHLHCNEYNAKIRSRTLFDMCI